jgi:hypothetical protein
VGTCGAVARPSRLKDARTAAMAANAVNHLVVVVEREIALLKRLLASVKRLGVLSMFVGLAAARSYKFTASGAHTLSVQRVDRCRGVSVSDAEDCLNLDRQDRNRQPKRCR